MSVTAAADAADREVLVRFDVDPAGDITREASWNTLSSVSSTAGPAPDPASLHALVGVEAIRQDPSGTSLTVSEVHRTLPALLVELDRCGATLTRLATHHATVDVAKGVDADTLGRHYEEHVGKPFFADLVDFITSGPIV